MGIRDWIELNRDELIVVCIAVVLLAAGAWGTMVIVNQDSEARASFMRQCLEDRKEYECVAMWRAGQSHTTVVPIYTPTR